MKLLFLIVTLFVQAPKPIDIEMVRKDALSKPHITPEDFIRKLKPASFKVMYAGDLCFVHLPYKSPSGEPFAQSSDLMIYRMTDGKWIFENLITSWYNIELLDATHMMFLADVKFCDNGPCQTYKSVSYYDGRQLFVLRKYNGFDKSSLKGKLAVGDSVTNSYTLYDFMVQDHQTAYTLKRKVEAVASVSKDLVRKKVLLDNFERVIVNY